MSNKISQIGRVAFRVEGENWNAYWALPDTMKGALFIASTKFAIVENPATMIGGRTTSEPASSASPRATFPPR